MIRENIARNTTYLTTAYVGQKILSFFYFVLIARFIGVEDLGKYSFALAFTTIFAVFIDLGLTQTLVREAAKFMQKAGEYIAAIFTVKLLLAGIVYLLVVAAINLLGYPPLTKNLVYLSGIVMALDSLSLSFWGVFRGCRNLKYEAIGIVINQVIILSSGLAILLLGWPLPYLMLPFILGSLWNVIYSAHMMRIKLNIRLKLVWNKPTLKFLFVIAAPFALLGIFTRVYGYIDSVLLSKMVGDAAVGWYNTAMKIPFALQFIPAAFGAAIYPAFSNFFEHDREKLIHAFEQTMKLLALVAFPIAFGIFSLADPIIPALFGEEYREAVAPLQILVFSLGFVFLNFPLGALMNACNRQLTNTKLVGLTMLINVAANIILIPKFSYNGAAAAFLISHAFLFFTGLAVCGRIIRFSRKNLWLIVSKTIVSAALMALPVILLKDYCHYAILMAAGVVLYVGFLYVLRGFSRQDIQYLISALMKKVN